MAVAVLGSFLLLALLITGAVFALVHHKRAAADKFQVVLAEDPTGPGDVKVTVNNAA